MSLRCSEISFMFQWDKRVDTCGSSGDQHIAVQAMCFEAPAVDRELDGRDVLRCTLLVQLRNWPQVGADTSGRRTLN